ncbi:hypothetical protein [Oceanobacillus limi]|uniref:hypothetical protein n=1 Tax=Oceanobacillus limi TaxID=930131 RepID=UPI000B889E77|nr:hypothetical protein [Oceanobacillus limi]
MIHSDSLPDGPIDYKFNQYDVRIFPGRGMFVIDRERSNYVPLSEKHAETLEEIITGEVGSS